MYKNLRSPEHTRFWELKVVPGEWETAKRVGTQNFLGTSSLAAENLFV